MVGLLDSFFDSLSCHTTVVCQFSRSDDLFPILPLLIFHLAYQCVSDINGRLAIIIIIIIIICIALYNALL